jgi:hypothetical protein
MVIGNAEALDLKKEYDFGKGRLGVVVAPTPGKMRITIRGVNGWLPKGHKKHKEID